MTARQLQVLRFMASFQAESGTPPSLRMIAAGIGYSTPANVHRIVTSLAQQGFVRRTGAQRGRYEVVRQPARNICPCCGRVTKRAA